MKTKRNCTSRTSLSSSQVQTLMTYACTLRARGNFLTHTEEFLSICHVSQISHVLHISMNAHLTCKPIVIWSIFNVRTKSKVSCFSTIWPWGPVSAPWRRRHRGRGKTKHSKRAKQKLSACVLKLCKTTTWNVQNLLGLRTETPW